MFQSKVISGTKHYYEIDGEGEWLILIHGWAGSTLVWKKEVEYLSRFFKVLTYDLRGHGQTGENSLSCYDLKLVADDLKELMDDLNIATAHLCSLNLGTLVTQGLALYHPERIKSLVMIGPSGKHTGLTKIVMFLVDKIIGTIFSKRTILETMTYLAMPTPPEKTFRKSIIRESRKLSEKEIAKWWNITKNDGFYKDLPVQAFPTLILIGEFDWLYINQAQQLSKYFPKTILRVIPRAGHGVFLQNPAKCKEEILKFYREIIFSCEINESKASLE